MQNKNSNNGKLNNSTVKGKRIIIIGVSALLLLTLVFGIVLFAVAWTRNLKAVVKYEGVLIDRGVASYLASTYKTVFLSELEDGYDAPEFWESEYKRGETYGELLQEKTLEYIKGVTVGAFLFDRYSSLSSSQRDAISKACSEVLEYKADGNKSKFNDLCRDMGFDFEDFERATELIYKSELAKEIIYGINGSSLQSPLRYDECDEYYYNEFVHVKILYIPTRKKIVTDSQGKYVYNSDGLYHTEDFTREEYLERVSDIEKIRELISSYNNDGDVQMSPEYFAGMEKKYNLSQEFIDTGYYFSPYSTYTARFAEDSGEYLPAGYKEAFVKQMSAVVESSFSMSVGEYHEIEGDFGTVFVYKYHNDESGYLSITNVAQFHDFYDDCASYLYTKTVQKIVKDVTVRDSYFEISPTEIPYNYIFIATVG